MVANRAGLLLRQFHRLLGQGQPLAADDQLLERFVRQKDEPAFAALMRRHGPLVWGISRRVAGNEQDAEDVFQATFLLLARKAASIRKRASLSSWLHGVALRLALRTRAEAARRRRHECRALASCQQDPSADVTWKELRGLLDQELAALPEKYRAPILLCYFEALTQEEAANRLGWSKRRVKDRLARGRRRLRARLARRGITLSAALTGSLLNADHSLAIPASLSASTLQAALLFAAHQPTTDLISLRVLALIEAGLRASLVRKAQLGAVLLLGTLLLGGAGLLARQAARQARAEPAIALPEEQATVLMSIARDGALRVEEIATGIELLRQKFPGDVDAYLALSSDDSTLAVNTGANTHKLFVWKWQAGESPRQLVSPDDYGREVAFSPDGRSLAETSDREPTVRVWNVEGARLLHKLEQPDYRYHSHFGVAFSPDGRTLAATAYSNEDTAIHLWDAGTGRFLKRLPLDGGGLAFSRDGRLLVSGSRVWDLDADKELSADDQAHRSYVEHIATGANGLIVTAGNDHTIRVWDAAAGKQRLLFGYNAWICGIALSPDGTKLAANVMDDSIRLLDLTTGREIFKLLGHGNLGSSQRPIAFTPDGRYVLDCAHDMYLRKWDVRTGKAVLEHAIRPAGVRVLDEDSDERDRRELLFRIGPGCFTPDGRNYVLEASQNFFVFDTATGKQVRQFARTGSLLISLAVSPDGNQLLTSRWGDPVETKLPGGAVQHSTARKHPVSLWDLTDGKLRKQILLPEQGAGPVAFSADGKRFAAASQGQGERAWIRVWDLATGQQLHEIKGLRGQVNSLAFMPDGKRLVSGMQDSTVLIWDLTTHP